jgi:3-polyprenyl-4-hydroxybenzoate decarboxylase
MLSLTLSPRIIEHGDEVVVLGQDGYARTLSGDSARLATAVLNYVTVPRTRAEIFAHLQTLTGSPVEPAAVVSELLTLLCDSGVFEPPRPEPEPCPAPQRRRLVLGLCGAMAAVRAPELLLRLFARGFELEVAMTRAARRFVAPLGLQALTHREVHTSLWGSSRRGVQEQPAPHIWLGDWAELMLVWPASATTLFRIAHGDCSDLVAAIAIAARVPVVLVPSMNLRMYSSPAVQRNLSQLRADGFYVVRPGRGFEVAQAPAARTLGYGPSTAVDAVAELARFVADHSGPKPHA